MVRYLNDSLNGDLKHTSLTREENDLKYFLYSGYACNMATRKSLLGFMFMFFGDIYKLEGKSTINGHIIYHLSKI